LRAFFNIAAAWDLNARQQRTLLGNPPSSTFFKWKREMSAAPRPMKIARMRMAPITPHVLERISYVLGIYKALQILIPDMARADAWISSPNTAPLSTGHSALDRMLEGNIGDLYAVRQYLDAQRG